MIASGTMAGPAKRGACAPALGRAPPPRMLAVLAAVGRPLLAAALLPTSAGAAA